MLSKEAVAEMGDTIDSLIVELQFFQSDDVRELIRAGRAIAYAKMAEAALDRLWDELPINYPTTIDGASHGM